MKRQVAILGPTPAFIRWSIRQRCLLRADTDLDSVDQTEKRLRALRALSVAVHEQRVHDGFAIKKFADQWKAFRVAEITQAFGGMSAVESCCQGCPANVTKDASEVGPWVGCHGWLFSETEEGNLIDALQQVANRSALDWPTWVLPTDPAWFGVWALPFLQGDSLAFVSRLIRLASQLCPEMVALQQFSNVLSECQRLDLTIDIESIPEGFSDGLIWELKRHCHRCKATYEPEARHCHVCGKSGKGHPEIKKRVLGLRPYVDLDVLMTGEKVDLLLKSLRQLGP